VHGHAKGSLHYIAIFSLLSQQKNTEARLRELASTDSLTGLINRSLLYDRAGQILAHSHRHQRRAAFLFLDLDHFKPVNDELGHEAGDQVLKTVAKRILACVRESDTVARYGGDEFMVVLTDLKENDEAAAIAEKIRHGLSETITLTEGECRVGVSIGISLYPDDGDTVDELIQHADQAMYWAKEQGRGRIAFFHAL
jgi:diguanylate cyclase (GGDEF)-like protein